MPDSTLITVLTGTGVCGVFCVLFLFGFIYPKAVIDDLRAERTALRAAVAAERDRADAAVAAAQATRDMLTAMQSVMLTGRSAVPQAPGPGYQPQVPPAGPAITGKAPP